MTILIPHYRTARRAAGADITVIEEISQGNGTGTLPNLVFAGTPADGEKLVAIVASTSAPSTVPSGFSLVASYTATADKGYVYEKTAASESGTYTWAAGSRCAVLMARLSSGTYDTSGSNSGATVSSLIMPSAGLTVPANSYVMASWHMASGSIVSSVDNSFTVKITNSAYRAGIASRKYTTAGASEQVTGTLNGTVATVGGIMAVFKP